MFRSTFFWLSALLLPFGALLTMPISTARDSGLLVGYYRPHGKSDKSAFLFFNGQPYWRYHDPKKAYALRFCDDFKTIRFEVRSGDNQAWVGGGRHEPTMLERAEIFSSRDIPFEQNHAFFGKPYFLFFSFLIEPGVATKTDPIILQFHSTDDKYDVPSHPPLQFRLRNDHLSVLTVADSDKKSFRETDYPPESARVGHIQTVQRYLSQNPLKRNRWYNFAVRAVFHPEHGSLLVHLDGKPIVSMVDLPMGHNDEVGPYLQFGIYRYKSSETLSVRYSQVSHGNMPLKVWSKRHRKIKSVSQAPFC